MTNSESYEFLQEQILQECQAMAKHIFASGLKVRPGVIETIESFVLKQNAKKDAEKQSIQDLVQAHAQLADIVAPATPRAIMLLDKDFAKGMAKFLGPVLLIRSMILLCLFFVLLFSFISLCPEFVMQILKGYIQSGPNTIDFFLAFAAAGIGASFCTLYKANEYILNHTFDKKYESTYWIRFFLGLFSGIILAQLIPIEGDWKAQAKPTLAMLGGFSSLAVYKILSRLIEMLEAIVPSHKKSPEEQVLKNRLMEQATFFKIEQEEKKQKSREETLKSHFDMQMQQEKLKIASRLFELQKNFSKGENIEQQIALLLRDLLPEGKKEEGHKIESTLIGEEEGKQYPFLQFEEEKNSSDFAVQNIAVNTAKQLPPVNIRNMKQEELLLPLKKI